MVILTPRKDRGIAIIIVMIVIVVLSVLAGGFAYTMKVETKLARNSSYESDMEFLGRSGVELGRYVLAMQLGLPGEGNYTALNQKWAGGWGGTNELLADIDLSNNELGPGRFSVKIVDMERKFNLSQIHENNTAILEKALDVIGVDGSEISTITDSYLDWTDPDEKTRPHGAESRDYMRMDLKRPYFAKNGPIDDLSELLLIKGVRPAVYFGSSRAGHSVGGPGGHRRRPHSGLMDEGPLPSGSGFGLVDLFTPISGSGVAVNVNTASTEVLQLLPGVDAQMAQAIVASRNGSDNSPGSEDDIPFINTGELINVPGLDPQIMQVIRNFLTVQSFLFEITVDAEIGGYKRQFVALVHRRSRTEIPILYFHWK
ncbi:MAG: general secretion pathway protein GspK [Pedosphaera sp.]|nr:general secretion pathway protein GspK [Pedosphaera sp.]